MLKKSILPLIIVSSLCLLLSACKEQTASAEETPEPNKKTGSQLPQNSLKQLNQQLLNATADKSCQNNHDCATMAIGSKACGGPSRFLVYAKANVDMVQLEKLASDYTQAEASYNQQNDMISNCMMEQAPAVACQQNMCVEIQSNQRLEIQ